MYDPEDYPEHRALGSRARRWADPCCNQELGPLLFEIPDERQPLEAPLVTGFNVHPSRFRPPEEVESPRSKGPTRIDNSSPPPDDGDPPEAGELPVDSALARWGGGQEESSQWFPPPPCGGAQELPFHIRGKGLGGFAGKDTDLDKEIEQFMRLFEVPNATIGILSSDQRLVCAKAYSLEGIPHPAEPSVVDPMAYLDGVPSPQYPVVRATPKTLFRIGSISKLITAYVGLLATTAGFIRLSTRAGDVLPYLDSPGIADASLEQVLRHTSGLSNRRGGDWEDPDEDAWWPPELWPPTGPTSGVTIAEWMNDGCFPVTREQEIKYADNFLKVINGQAPDTVGVALYSNFGLDLAGEMIAAAVDMPFDVLCQSVFSHLDMTNTIVGNYALERYPEEVLYYPNYPNYVRDQVAPHCGEATKTWNPYDRNLLKSLPSGGWTSTPADLLRFVADLVRSSRKGSSGFLPRHTVQSMWDHTYDTHRPSGSLRNTLVWRVDSPLWRVPSTNPTSWQDRNRWHTGGMDGVSAALYVYPSTFSLEDNFPPDVPSNPPRPGVKANGLNGLSSYGTMNDAAVVFAMNRSKSAPERLFSTCAQLYKGGTSGDATDALLGKLVADIIPAVRNWGNPGEDLFDEY